MVYTEGLWEDKLRLFTKEMVETASKSSKQHLKYEFFPLFDSWAKNTSVSKTIITKKADFCSFSTRVLQFSVLKNFLLIFYKEEDIWLSKKYNVYYDSKLL